VLLLPVLIGACATAAAGIVGVAHVTTAMCNTLAPIAVSLPGHATALLLCEGGRYVTQYQCAHGWQHKALQQ
jgi:hypothetical protein